MSTTAAAALTSTPWHRRTGPGGQAQLAVFDILHLRGSWVTDEPWERRRRLLEELDLPPAARPVPTGPVALLWKTTAQLGIEGVVAKRLDSRYRPGTRTRNWIRAKHWRTTTVRISGYTTDPAGRVAALLVTPDTDPGPIAARVELGLHGPPRRLLSEYLPQLDTHARAGAVFVEPCVRMRHPTPRRIQPVPATRC